ncbi:MAG: DoxX family protein [Flavisolibacter sp.]|jgi:putative oxidoreductase
MRSSIFSVRRHYAGIDVMFLLLRLVIGLAFVIHGWPKIHDPLHWMGKDASFAPIWQALAAISEFCGGIALMLGFLTRIAAFGILCTMAVAVYEVHFVYKAPFVNTTGPISFEIPAVYFVIMLLFIVAGPGRISLDRLLFGSKTI